MQVIFHGGNSKNVHSPCSSSGPTALLVFITATETRLYLRDKKMETNYVAGWSSSSSALTLKVQEWNQNLFEARLTGWIAKTLSSKPFPTQTCYVTNQRLLLLYFFRCWPWIRSIIKSSQVFSQLKGFSCAGKEPGFHRAAITPAADRHAVTMLCNWEVTEQLLLSHLQV